MPATGAPVVPSGAPPVVDSVEAIVARLPDLEALPGFLGACLAEGDSGFPIAGRGKIDAEGLAVLAAHLVRTETQVIQALDLDDSLEEILITLGSRIHLLQPLGADSGLIAHLVLDRGGPTRPLPACACAP